MNLGPDHPQPSPEASPNRLVGWLQFFSQRAVLAFCAALGLLLFFVAAINIQYGVEDERIVEAFESDEHHIYQRVSKNIHDGNFDPNGYYHYPYGWFTAGAAVGRFFKARGYNVDVRFVVGIFRVISILGGLATVYLVFRLLCQLGVSSHLAAVGGIYIITIPDFYFWAQSVHPDVPQAALVVAAFLFSFRDDRLPGAVKATFFHGLALTTKFGGAFSFPFSMLYHSLRRFGAEPPGSDGTDEPVPWKKIAMGVLACLTVLVGLYLATNPYLFTHLKEVLDGISFIKKAIAGTSLATTEAPPWDGWLWFRTIGSGIGPYGKVLIVGGGAMLVVHLAWRLAHLGLRGFIACRSSVQLATLLLFVLACFALHTATIAWPALRYTYHFLPALVILCIAGLYFATRSLPRLVLEVVIVALALSLVPRAETAFERMKAASNKPKADIAELGRWFEGRYPQDALIRFEIGSYVPVSYFASVSAWGMSEAALHEPELKAFVLCEDMSGRWIWKAAGTNWSEGKMVGDPNSSPRAEQAYKVYRYLQEHSHEWKLVYEKGRFMVFERVR
ncbi:MAG: glycosyltransferase family 39 protein [Opitutae bacterium]|nr:glycosyltransferase family 39 protein [Opitutae bacterium]